MKHLNIFHSDDGHVALSIDDFVDMRQCQTNLLRQVNELCREKAALERETELLRVLHEPDGPVGWQNAVALLPDKPGEYLCATSAGKRVICRHDDGTWTNPILTGAHSVDVTHWMPLPKLPLTMEERTDIIKNT